MRTDKNVEEFEPVLTVDYYYDGVPRHGIANYRGVPHIYQCVFDDTTEDWTSFFDLSPIETEVLDLALEKWAIWKRWKTAFHQGLIMIDTHPALDAHPALPPDQKRSSELREALEGRLAVDPARTVRCRADFRRIPGEWDGLSIASFEVHWQPTE